MDIIVVLDRLGVLPAFALVLPVCSTKGIECRYSASSRQSTEARIQKIANVSTGRRNTIPSPPESDVFAESSLATNSDVDAIIDSVLVPSDLVSTNFGDASIDDINQDLGFSSFLGLQGYQNAIQTPLSGWYPVEGQQTTSYFNLSIPAQVTSNPRSLVKRVRFKIGGEGTAALILHTLKSYLRMMMHHHTLPPFIHPRTISPDFDQGNTEPLVNCVSLVHMIGRKVRGSRKLFWKNVRLECERLLSDHLSLSKWELLTAMQAVCIYILVRLDEGPTEENDFDSLLLAAVFAMSKQLQCYDIVRKSQSASHADSLDQKWEDWIFEESERRLCAICRIVNLLVYFEPASMCDMSSVFVVAPLPAPKGLWEANDGLSWHVESKNADRIKPAFGLTKNGQVVKLGELEPNRMHTLPGSFSLNVSQSESAENWEEWCSGMDGLGGIIMLAASLVV
ncbi:hypothetical protein PEBR_36153 [Penicillium brasilianum]|uniref:Transcription factor domain-containing protein n=1 Tax=Penicillium brasilianum TaxID=104259 RepID=A0A1S9RCP2_PENBI|nr:hypothetical protein PEBR_36153 [Penicillium brasilianum]